MNEEVTQIQKRLVEKGWYILHDYDQLMDYLTAFFEEARGECEWLFDEKGQGFASCDMSKTLVPETNRTLTDFNFCYLCGGKIVEKEKP